MVVLQGFESYDIYDTLMIHHVHVCTRIHDAYLFQLPTHHKECQTVDMMYNSALVSAKEHQSGYHKNSGIERDDKGTPVKSNFGKDLHFLSIL
jgi:hypothetical protein